jgi:type IV pilus assembly protein PilY1
LVKVLDTLELDAYGNGLKADSSDATLKKGTWTINGLTVTLPAEPSTVEVDGIIDNANYFRYSKNYLNWMFFNTGVHSYRQLSAGHDGSDLPAKSRFYYAKKAILDVALSTNNKAYFGIYNFATTEGASSVQPLGKVVDTSTGALDPNFVNNINNMGTVIYSPLAEGLAQIGGYYASPSSGAVEYICQDSFVIVVSPGVSSEDQNAVGPQYTPSGLSDYDEDGAVGGIGEGNIMEDNTNDGIDNDSDGTIDEADEAVTYPIPTHRLGSTYLDDVAYYLHTHDIVGYRDGPQYVTTYTVGFMGDHESNLFLINTSNNGNGNVNLYDTTDSEYGKYHFTAENPENLAPAILAAVNDILERAASGTAVSVLATSGEGEGNLIQAYFRPVIPSGEAEVKWIGYLQSLWVDAYGNLREDTNQNRALDVNADKIVTYFVDSETGDTMIKRFDVSETTPYPDLETASYQVLVLDQISPLWEAGKILHQRSASDRKIFTYIDKDGDGAVDETINDSFDSSGEVVKFDTALASGIKPYLGVKDDATWSYLGSSHDERVPNLIDYIRGKDSSDLTNSPDVRPRTIDGNVWKLGDIIYSTPVAISKPTDNYHIIYADLSYKAYYDAFKDRETVVYVGANDGMLHAITSWEYNETSKEFTKPSAAGSSEVIGDELWAFIPQCQLPHLKWLADSDYGHVYYVDLKPKIFDAKILPDDTHYTDDDSDPNWGTFLLAGMNMGGKYIWAEGDFDYDSVTPDTVRHFYPSYVCMDVTDPRNPRLLWERTYTDLELTTSFPAVVRVKDKWFAVFGSGPSATAGNCYGTSTKKGHIFVVDLATGDAYSNIAQFGSGVTNGWLFETNESNAFMNSPVSIDKGLNYNIDGIYFGEAYLDTTWKGKLYKVTVPWADAIGDYDGTDVSNYSDNPLGSTNPWQCHPLFNVTRPITSSAALSLDSFGNVWLFVGSGRYFSNEDKTNTETQYMFGIKDPFFNNAQATYYHDYSSSLELEIADLFNADPYVIILGGEVYEYQTYFGDWSFLLAEARTYDGWIRSLTIPGERILTKFAILGGIVFTPSFVPNEDPCGFGGDSYLYGQYYETGTAYYKAVFTQGTEEVETESGVMTRVLDKTLLGMGKASSVGVHVGMESGAKGFIQQSTGVVTSKELTPAFNIKSGLSAWQEK